MKRFRFRFQSLLEMRQREEDQALKQVAMAQRTRNLELLRKKRILDGITDAYARIAGLSRSGSIFAGPEVFRLEQDFIAGSKVRIVQVDQAILRANRAVERATRSFLQARRKTRMMELLREKDQEEFKIEQRKKEAKELDELVILRHGRDNLAGGVDRAS